MTTTGFIWGIIAFIIGFASGYILKGKKNVTVLLILIFPLLTQAQNVGKPDIIYIDSVDILKINEMYNPYQKFFDTEPDTIKCVMLITDMQIINGIWDNRPYSVKGFRVLADYETYYLDVTKQRLPKNIIVWLDQNEQ